MIFVFQAEDGIRDYKVTGVQTCALPIFRSSINASALLGNGTNVESSNATANRPIAPNVIKYSDTRVRPFVTGLRKDFNQQIGRASCRERVKIEQVSMTSKETKT